MMCLRGWCPRGFADSLVHMRMRHAEARNAAIARNQDMATKHAAEVAAHDAARDAAAAAIQEWQEAADAAHAAHEVACADVTARHDAEHRRVMGAWTAQKAWLDQENDTAAAAATQRHEARVEEVTRANAGKRAHHARMCEASPWSSLRPVPASRVRRCTLKTPPPPQPRGFVYPCCACLPSAHTPRRLVSPHRSPLIAGIWWPANCAVAVSL